MLRFVLSNLDEAAADPVGEAGVRESLCVELGEGLRVEGTLEMLEGKRELEDVRVWS